MNNLFLETKFILFLCSKRRMCVVSNLFCVKKENSFSVGIANCVHNSVSDCVCTTRSRIVFKYTFLCVNLGLVTILGLVLYRRIIAICLQPRIAMIR